MPEIPEKRAEEVIVDSDQLVLNKVLAQIPIGRQASFSIDPGRQDRLLRLLGEVVQRQQLRIEYLEVVVESILLKEPTATSTPTVGPGAKARTFREQLEERRKGR